jgi:peptidoglycan/xylan/chitin deacetylase (PgdA/CDA1 family)
MRIVTFHNVLRELDSLDRYATPRLSIDAFEAVLDRLAARYRFVAPDDALLHIGEEDVAVLTFDDGYAGVLDHVFPLLHARGIAATMFVITRTLDPDPPLLQYEELEVAFRITRARKLDLDFAGRGVRALPDVMDRMQAYRVVKYELKRRADGTALQTELLARLGVTPDDCRRAAEYDRRFTKLNERDLATLHDAGWTIGSHTRTHRVVRFLDAADLEAEIAGSFDDLARRGFEAIPFAFPYGGADHISDDATALAIRAGYTCAMTMIEGDNDATTSHFALRRFDGQDL